MAWYDKAMEASKLTREVELPRQRSNGAAVVLVAAMAMFTAVAASAFVVRVRMHSSACALRAAPMPGPDVVKMDTIGAATPVVDDNGPLDPFHGAMVRGDNEAALQAWLAAPALERDMWRSEREAIAREFLDQQLERITFEIENGDCAAVSERLHRLGRLLPDNRDIPQEMALCTDQRGR
jgi:hypothetical protein